jgi:hypothetical protein
MKIVIATIGPMPQGLFDPMPVVRAKFEDGSEKELFDFFPDEISFTESEFIGLTEEEARSLKFKKDVAFLRS